MHSVLNQQESKHESLKNNFPYFAYQKYNKKSDSIIKPSDFLTNY